MTGRMRKTKITTLMNLTGWFSIMEMTKLNTATILWKAIHLKTPSNLVRNLKWDEQNLKFEVAEPRLQFTSRNFSIRACSEWNRIPDTIRLVGNISRFKKMMKTWIRELRPPD